MHNTLNKLNLSLTKKAQIDQQTFFDFYGLTLLPKEYLQQNPEVRKYRDVILQIVKDGYVEYFKKEWGMKVLEEAPGGAPLVERFETSGEQPYSVVNIVTCVKRLMEATQPDEITKLIDLINDAEHQTGSYFLFAPQMQQWISQALAIKASQSPQQLLPYMSSDVQDTVRDYLKVTGQSYIGQQTDWSDAVKYITENQYEAMAYRKQITPEMYEYFKNSSDDEIRALIVLDNNAPLEIRTYLAQNDRNDSMARNALLNWERIPVEVQQALLQNPDPNVQAAIQEEQGMGVGAKRLNLTNASILDAPRATLDLAIWDISDELPKLRPSVKEEIIDRFLRYIETYGGYFEPEKWIDGFYYTGSTATKRYTSSSDVDIHVLVDWNRLIKSNPDKKGDPREMWRKLQDIFWWTLNKETLPGTKHPVTYFVIPPGEEARHLETTEEAYDMQTDKWIVAPKNNDEPPIIEMEKIRNDADEIMNRVDLEIAKTKKGLIDYIQLRDILSDYGGDGEDIKKRIQDKLVEIEEALMSLKDEYDLLKDKRKDGFLTEAPIVDGLSQNWTPGNILFKLVERYKYMDVLRKVKKVLSEKETSLTDKEIPSVIDALTPKFESKLNLKKTSQEEEDMFSEFYSPPEGYDTRERLIYKRDEDGDEAWYDSKGNKIYERYPNGIVVWYEYDEKGNMTHSKRSDGYEAWSDYDEKGNMIHMQRDDVRGKEEFWIDYDREGTRIHEKSSDGTEVWYDGDGNWLYEKPENWKYEREFLVSNKLNLHKEAIDHTEPEDVQWGDKEVHQDWKLQRTNKPRYDDRSEWLPDAEKEHHPGTLKSHRLNLQKLSQSPAIEYDEKGNIIREKVHHEHDKEGNLVYEKWSDGYEARYNYDERRSIIHAKDSDGVEIWFDYDEEGNKTHERWNDGTEYWYDREGNIIHTEGGNEKVQGIAKRFNLKKTAQSEVGITRDEKGNIIYEKPPEETEVRREYDVNKNLIHEKYPSGVEVWYAYDVNGNLIHERYNDGHQFWYDETGNVVGSRYFDGNEWKEIGKVGNKKLSLRKTSQIDQQTFFDFYGLTLLPKEYLQQNPEVQKYRDVILQIVKDAYVEYFKKDWGEEELAKAPSGAPLVERVKSDEGDTYSIVNIVTCVKRLMETTQPDDTIKLIDLINDAEHQTGSYFLYAPQMQQWISQALAIKASQSPQQLLPHMSSDVQDILRDYLKATGQSYVGQQTDWSEAVKYITQNQYETMSYRKQITPEMYEYFKNSPDAEVRAMIVLDDRAPLHIRTYLAQNDQNDYMASNILLNREKIPVEVWQALLQNPDPNVQAEIQKEQEDRKEQGMEVEAKKLNLRKTAQFEAVDYAKSFLSIADQKILDYKMTGWPAERIAQELITQNIPPNRDGNWNQNMINVRWNTVIKPLLEEVTTLPEKRAVPMMHYTPILYMLQDYIDPNILISVFEARDSGLTDFESIRDYVHQGIGRVLTKEMWKILQEKHFANRGKQCINNKMAYFDQPKSPYDNRSYLEREPGPPESGQTEVGPGQSEEMGAANDDQWTGGEYDGLTNKPSTPGWTRKPEREKHLPEFNESVGWPGGQVRQVSRNNMIKLAENRLLWTEIINEVFDELLFN